MCFSYACPHHSINPKTLFSGVSMDVATYGIDVVTTDIRCIINTLYHVFLTFLSGMSLQCRGRKIYCLD